MEIGNLIPVDEILDIKEENECTIGSVQNMLDLIISLFNQMRNDVSDFEKNITQLKEKVQDQEEVLIENVHQYTEYLEELLNRMNAQASTKVPSKSGNADLLIRKYLTTHKSFTHKLTYMMSNHRWVRDQVLCTIDNLCISVSGKTINFGSDLYTLTNPISTIPVSIDDFISSINDEINIVYMFQEQVIKNIKIIEIAFDYINKIKQHFNI
jgi:hypothetical protein